VAIDEIAIGDDHYGDLPPAAVVTFAAFGTPGAYEVRFVIAPERELCGWLPVVIDAGGAAHGTAPITEYMGPGLRTVYIRPECRPPLRQFASSVIRIRCPE